MPTVPTWGWAQLLAQLTAQPGAGAHRRVSSAQLQGSDNPEGKTPDCPGPAPWELPWSYTQSTSLPPCFVAPKERSRRNGNPHRPSPHTYISALICTLLSSSLRLVGVGKPQAGQGLFGPQSTQDSSGFHSPSILLKLLYFPHRIILFRQRLHCPLRQ